MRVTELTRDCLASRRQARDLKAEGYERISENGHPIWMLSRGALTRSKIIDAIISADGKSVYIKIEPKF